jgi:hypothetical protein
MTFALAIAFELLRGSRLRRAAISKNRKGCASNQDDQCCGLEYCALGVCHEAWC